MSQPPETLLEVALTLAQALARRRVPYALGGALAYNLYARPRATLDVDVNVFVAEDDLEALFEVLRRLGIEFDEDAASGSAVAKGMFVVWWGDYKIDIFIASIPFQKEAGRTKVARTLRGKRFWFLSPESLIVFKLMFDRPKDKLDVVNLMDALGPKLDRRYVRQHVVDMLGEDDHRVAWWDERVRSL